MKYIKYYEAIDNEEEEPKLYDYVIMRSTVDPVKQFIENNVGQIFEIDKENDDVLIKYFNIPDNLKEYFIRGTRPFGYKLIKHWSKSKRELEAFISQNKFNL